MPSSILNSDDGVISGTSGLKNSGGDDGVLVFQSKGTETARIVSGLLSIAANSTAASAVRLHEDTDNGTNYVDIIAPSAIASNRTLTLPDSTGTIALLNSNPNLVASFTVSGSAVTNVDFSGIDLSVSKRFRLEVELIHAGGSACVYNLFTNNNTTTSNYYSQFMFINNTSGTFGRNNDADVTFLGSGGKAMITIDIGLAGNDTPCYRSFTNDGLGSSTTIKQATVSATFTAANITQLTFSSAVASQIGIGSTFRLYGSNA